MTEKEFRKNMYKGNLYKCGFCGKEVKDKPTLTLSMCRGMSCYDISDICESCLNEIKKKVVH